MADTKLQDAVDKMVDRLDRTLLRGLQRDGYLCAAKVFENKSWSSEQLAAAVERCQMPTQQLNQFMQQEMQNFQNRIQRCVQDCQERRRTRCLPVATPARSRLPRAEGHGDVCWPLRGSHVSLLPNISTRIEQAVAQVKQQQQQ
ncbi:Protein of unknown function DUF842, eukaryotic [Phytophthora cactorum]|nr:Protein of unknown function DUF842, eukaryotic [Phytophthora cactorum]